MTQDSSPLSGELAARRQMLARMLLIPFPAMLVIVILLALIGAIAVGAGGQAGPGSFAGFMESAALFLIVPLYAAIFIAPIGIVLCLTRWRSIWTPLIRALVWADLILLTILCVGLPAYMLLIPLR